MSCIHHLLSSRYCAKCTPLNISLNHQPDKEGVLSAQMGSESFSDFPEVS